MTAMITPEVIEGRFVEQEHRRVRSGLGGLRDAIGGAHRLTRSSAADSVARALTWIRRDLLPHAAWEEAWLYPHFDRAVASPWATRALRLEHEQIREVAAGLEPELSALREHWSPEVAFRVVVALTRLETLVTAHLAQEEWFIEPLLAAEQPHGPGRSPD